MLHQLNTPSPENAASEKQQAASEAADKLAIRIRIWLQPYRRLRSIISASAAALSQRTETQPAASLQKNSWVQF